MKKLQTFCEEQIMMMNKKHPLESESEKTVVRIREKAQNLFLSRELMCSETVLTVLNQGLKGDLPPEMAVRLASGLPEGMGGGCVCGSLSGGVLALGLFLGRNGPGIGSARQVRRVTKSLHDCFRERFGATCCRVLTKGVKRGSKAQFEKCALTAGFAAETATRLILENRPELLNSADSAYLGKKYSRLTVGFKQILNMLCL